MPPHVSASPFRDPAFMENRNAPVHRWVPWIAGFSGQFVQDAFRSFLPHRPRRHQLILDPFSGVGTTLVEAALHGHHTIGFEINPYASLVARVKLNALDIRPHRIREMVETVKHAASSWKATEAPLRYRPAKFISRIPFFSKTIEPQILSLLELLDNYPDKQLADLGKIALGAVLVRVSNYTYEPSLSSRPGAGKPLLEEADVSAVFVAKLSDMLEDVAALKATRAHDRGVRREVHTKDFLRVNGELADGEVDLMITSPPYMNNYHYIRNTRPHLFWLAFVSSPKELRRLEHENFGKFWQTVRSSGPVPLEFAHRRLSRVIDSLRQTRVEEGAYGGPGWANYVATYFNDCNRFTRILRRVLRRGGVGVIVIGNSIIQGIDIQIDKILGELAEVNGLSLQRIVPLRKKRVGASITSSSVRRGQINRACLYESAVILRKA